MPGGDASTGRCVTAGIGGAEASVATVDGAMAVVTSAGGVCCTAADLVE
jgi:hypothetical protein